MVVSAAISARIQSLIDELQPGDSLGQWLTRVCKDELNALPLRGNRIYLWALRPDGTVLRMDHEAFNHPAEPETDPLVLHAVLTHGARTHPDLQDLVPARPDGARPCRSCEGSGMVACKQDGYDSCLGCNGLGWVVTGQRG
jgi:hypothetical protein